MNITIAPGLLSGTHSAIASKSHAHRLAICAALADQPTTMALPTTSVDIETTLDCLEALGATITRTPGQVTIIPLTSGGKAPTLNCMESGSTFRFLLPVAAAVAEAVSFEGCGRLPQRPIGDLRTALEAHGVAFSAPSLPFATQGKLQGGDFALPGNVSSQYITGLLLALPKAEGDSTITLTSPLQSAAYVDITLRALAQFGVVIHQTATGYQIPGNQTFTTPGTVAVEGDWSNAAFFLVAGAMGKPVTLTGLDVTSPQGDKAILDVLRQFGAQVTVDGTTVTVAPGALRGCTIDIDPIPDALPILAVLATCATGETHFINGARLRLKESDRLESTAVMVNNLGGCAIEEPEGLIVRGTPLQGGTVDSYQDHRIAMAAAIATTVCQGDVCITRAEAVEKSYPQFYHDFNHLGGYAHGI